ncbi:unnamed protein product [Colias eurytheme]|nr:unnamed protein product [Colias eurytheme]
MSYFRIYSHETISEFIDCFRNHPSLWQIKSHEYKDTIKKLRGYSELLEIVHMESLDNLNEEDTEIEYSSSNNLSTIEDDSNAEFELDYDHVFVVMIPILDLMAVVQN